MKNRFLMWVLTAFALTLFICTFLSVKWIVIIAFSILALFVPAAIIRFSAKKTVITCLISALIAILLFYGTNYNAGSVEQKLSGETTAISGVITDLDTNSAGNLARYKIKLTHIDGEDLPFYKRYCIYLYSDTKEPYLPGGVYNGTLDFFDSHVEFGFGRENRVLVSAFCRASDFNVVEAAESNIYFILYKLRTVAQNRIAYGMQATQGLLRSVCFGDTDALEPDLLVSLRRIGLSHVTAVSGLHLSFVVLLFDLIFILLGIHYKPRHIIKIFIAVFFTALVGFRLSCIRACIMLVLYSVAMVLDLFSDSLTSLSVAVLFVVLLNPFAIRDVGFLLSVSATAGIVLLFHPVENFLFPPRVFANRRINGIYRTFTGICACSVSATIATLPIVIAVFGTVSLIGPFANTLLLLPLQGLFMLGILMVMLSWIPGIGAVLGFLCDCLYFCIRLGAKGLGSLSFATVAGVDFLGIFLLFLFFAMLAVAIFDFLRHQRRTFMALFSMFLLFGFAFNRIYTVAHPNNSVEIAFVDVGQGDCTVISKDHSAVIIDYGGSSQKRYNLIDYLKKKNIYNIELLAFTHLHDDHTNGLRTLLQNVYVQQILYPNLNYKTPELMSMIQSQNHRTVDQNEMLTVLNDVSLSVISDAVFDTSLTNENERCVCYRIQYGSTSVLLTGDLEGEAELKLLDKRPECTILKVAHHGSETSSLYPFIKAVAPEIAVISVGDNVYGLPKGMVIERIKTVCSQVITTENEGTIVFSTNGSTMERILHEY